jgi:MFS family permease
MATTQMVAAKAEAGLKRMSFLEYIWFSAYQLAFSFLWGAIGVIILPAVNGVLTERLLVGGKLTIGPFVLDNAQTDVKVTTLGIISFTGLTLAAISQPMFGTWSDSLKSKIGKRMPFIAVGSILTLLTLMGMTLAVVAGWLAFFLMYCALQFVSNIAYGPYHGLLPDMVPEIDRGKASGVLGGMQMLGTVASGLVLSVFFDVYKNLTGAMLTIIGLVAVCAILTLLFLREPAPPPGRIQPTEVKGLRRLLSIFSIEAKKYPDFVWLLFARTWTLTGIATVSTYALYWMGDVVKPQGYKLLGLTIDSPTKAVSILLAIVIMFAFIAAIVSGPLSDRFGRKPLIALSGVFGIMGVVPFVFVRDLGMVLVFAIFIGLCYGMFTAVDWAMVTDLIPRSQAGKYMGVSNLATAMPQAIAPLLGGILGAIFSVNRNYDAEYAAIFSGAAVYFLLGIVLLIKVREHKVREEEVAIREDLANVG